MFQTDDLETPIDLSRWFAGDPALIYSPTLQPMTMLQAFAGEGIEYSLMTRCYSQHMTIDPAIALDNAAPSIHMGEFPFACLTSQDGDWPIVRLAQFMASAERVVERTSSYSLNNYLREPGNVYTNHATADKTTGSTKLITYDGLRKETVSYMIINNMVRPLITTNQTSGTANSKYTLTIRSYGNFVCDPKDSIWTRSLAPNMNSGLS